MNFIFSTVEAVSVHITFLQPNFNFGFICGQLIGNLSYIFKIPFPYHRIMRVSPRDRSHGGHLKFVAFCLPHILYHLSIPLLGIYIQLKCVHYLHQNTCFTMFIAALCAKTWKLPSVPQENSSMFAHWKSTEQ